MSKFELLLDYTWWAICQEVYEDNLRVQVDSCCILFEYLFMHAHGGTSGTRVLAQNVPASIFEQEILRVLTELNAIEIACARITTCDFHSSSNQAVPYIYIYIYIYICMYVCIYVYVYQDSR